MQLTTCMFTYAFEPFTKVENEGTGETGVLAGVMHLWKQDAIMYCLVVDGKEGSSWLNQNDLLTGTGAWRVVENGKKPAQ